MKKVFTLFILALTCVMGYAQSAITLPVKGTALAYEGACIVNDNNGNGLLEPGETADLRVFINNTGDVTAHSVRATLSVSSNYLTINNNTVTVGDIAVNEQNHADFSVILSANASDPFPMPFVLTLVDAGSQTSEFNFSMYNITTTANPQESGTLTGTGTFGTDTEVSLSAIPNDGYTFISWKNGNTVVSYTDFSINVSENAEYVANFNTISNAVPVGHAAVTSGSLPTNSYYNYSLTEQIYTTEELGEAFEISSVSFFNAGSAKTRNCRVYLKHTEKAVFQSESDWEAVVPEDLFFEGNITFTVGQWTTVYFDHAFAYDGNHNVLLAIDDNTGSYSQGLSCRTFEVEGASIYNRSDETNYNPYNPSNYSGNFAGVKNQVLFGIASYDYTVTVTADLPDGGTVNVNDGPFYYGQPCTATARPSGDNVFYYWSENGERVSVDATYNFRVMANRQLVAHFGPPVTVTVAADPEEGGTVSGGGSYGIGQPITLSATANPGYVFSHWALDGDTVSCTSTCTSFVPGAAEYVAVFDPLADGILAVGQATMTNTLLPGYSYYNYSLTQQIYTADEIGGECHVTSVAFFNTGYEKTRNFTIFMVNTDKESFSSNTDWIEPTVAQRVFSGEVVMAKDCWTTIPLDNEFVYDGISNLALIVDDNSGNWTYNHMSCRVYDADGYQAIRIYNDNTNYNPYNPSSYTGARMEVKNQILLGLASAGLEENLTESFCFVKDNVLYVSKKNDKAQLNVLDVLGRMVKSVELTDSSCSVADLKAGVYLVQLIEGVTVRVQKLTINQ